VFQLTLDPRRLSHRGESMTTAIPPWTGANTPYRRWLPSPLLGEPEYVIERYVFDKMVESGQYDWVATQWAISHSDRPDIVARSDRPGGPSWWVVVEVKATPLREKHFRQLERYVRRLGEMVGHKNLVGFLIAPDIPLHQLAHGRGRTFFAPPEWIALNRTLEAIDPQEDELP
jgi:hypothetical protein